MSPTGAALAPRVLLTVSGEIADDLDDAVDRGDRPRADHRAIRDRIGCDVADARRALDDLGRLGRLVRSALGDGAALALYCFRHRRSYDVVLTDGEQVGFPFALLCRVAGRRGCRHVMIAHIVSTRTKVAMVRTFRLAPLIDRWITYCSWQRDFVVNRFHVQDRKVVLSPFMVDTRFFDPASVDEPRQRLICAVGLERRDYPTFLRAVDGLDVDVVVAAASPWSRQGDSTEGEAIPANVVVAAYSQAELRRLYARSLFSVMPLVDVDFQAGITAILESMAMERAVVCSRTSGQIDTIVEHATGRYVPPGDPPTLRRVIVELLGDAAAADRMGAAAREWVLDHAELDVYAAGLASVVSDVLVDE